MFQGQMDIFSPDFLKLFLNNCEDDIELMMSHDNPILVQFIKDKVQ